MRLLFAFMIGWSLAYESPTEYSLNLIDAYSQELLTQEATPQEYFFAAYNTAYRIAVDIFNNKTCNFGGILPNTTLKLNNLIDYAPPPVVVKRIIEIAEAGESLAIGIPNPARVISGALAGSVLDVAILSSYGYSTELGSTNIYPYVSRMYITSRSESSLLLQQLQYYGNIQGPGWDKLAVLASIDSLSISNSNEFIQIANEFEFSTLAYQQYLLEAENLDMELREIKDSGARVIYSATLGDFVSVLERADEVGLIGDSYVWLIPSYTSSAVLATSSPLLTGILTTQQAYPYAIGLPDPYSECYIQTYQNANPEQYFGAGGAFPPGGTLTWENFDTILTVVHALDKLDRQEMLDGRYISAELWSETIRSVSFEGITGSMSFDQDGNRIGFGSILYFQANATTVLCAVDLGNGLEQVADVVWYSNTTKIPDLDIRDSFSYWSCEDGEEGVDETGKTITIHSPDGSDVDEIDSGYHCDTFIDCKNLSDETNECSTNYLILYIVFGALSVILIFIAIALLIFVIIFGVLLNYQCVRTRSPSFLMLLLISIIIGYASNFAYYGKPHPVACVFRPWLLGVPVISMIAVLSAKNLRVYRIFKAPLKRVRISDFDVLLVWGAFMIPSIVILILWMIVSTPTADFIEVKDTEHYVCTTGGFTGSPGGYIFFAIFVGYAALVLSIGAIISILARNIPSMFNESRLLTISIYNLGFLATIIIPVYLVVLPINPFVAWILRACSVLYAFTTTMSLQFGNMVWTVFITNRCKNIQRQHNLSTTKTVSNTLISNEKPEVELQN